MCKSDICQYCLPFPDCAIVTSRFQLIISNLSTINIQVTLVIFIVMLDHLSHQEHECLNL